MATELSSPPIHPTPFAWRSWPIVDESRTRWFWLSMIAFIAAIVWLATHRPLLAAAASVAVMATAWRALVATQFEVNPSGLTEVRFGRTRRIPWRSVRYWELAHRGIWLRSRSSPAPADALRDLYIPWSSHRDELVRSVEFYLGPPGLPVGSQALPDSNPRRR